MANRKLWPQLLACLLLVSVFLIAGTRVNASLTSRGPILITSNSGFTLANGVTGGSGTASDPYVISGWEISTLYTFPPKNVDLEIRNTTAYFVIQNVSVVAGDGDGVVLTGVVNGRIESSSLYGLVRGLMITHSSNVVLANNNLSGSEYGVVLSGVSNISMTGNVVGGLVIETGEHIQLSGNNFLAGRYGTATVWYGHDVTISNNVIEAENHPGLCICSESWDIKISNNTISGGVNYSIGVSNSSCVVISNNQVKGCLDSGCTQDEGIELTYTSYIQVFENDITQESIGIDLFWSYANLVYHNRLANNTLQARDNNTFPGLENSWDNGYPGGGNFWSDYAGVDNCSGPLQDVCPSPDAIGDTPYVFNYSQDSYPLMKPFVASPDPSPSVGGAVVPVDKLALLAPFVLLALPVAAGTVLIASYSRRIRTNKGKMREQSIA